MLCHSTSILSLALWASLVTAHFGIDYPEWRGDSFATGASQWIYPCANVNQTALTNRTLWPVTGGSLELDLHHPWTYIFVNLGIGTDYPTFNISLTNQFINETGNGTLCLQKLALPAGLSISDGQNASIQVVTVGATGSALYNCADITFSSNATTLGNDQCSNSSNVIASFVNQEVNGTTPAPAENSTTKPSAASGGFSGSILTAGMVAGLVALAMNWLL